MLDVDGDECEDAVRARRARRAMRAKDGDGGGDAASHLARARTTRGD
jgi:hypothetical protein